MAIEENIAGEKGKEDEHAEESTSPPQAVSSASVPSATTPPPPVSEKDAAKAPPSPPQPPPRPPQKVQTPLLQPLPPPHPHATAHRGSRHPEVFPVGYYDPSDATLPNGPEQVVFSKGWRITKLVMSTASLVCSVVVVGLGIAIASWGGKFSIQEALFGITTATVCLSCCLASFTLSYMHVPGLTITPIYRLDLPFCGRPSILLSPVSQTSATGFTQEPMSPST